MSGTEATQKRRISKRRIQILDTENRLSGIQKLGYIC